MYRQLAFHFLVFAATATAHGQDLSYFERSGYSPASFYNYSEPADVTMLVNVWGTVRNPGLYTLPEKTTLSHLLSLSGGPIVAPREDRQDRTIQVLVFRPGPGGSEIVFQMEMNNDVAAMNVDPTLVDGDIVTVETIVHRRFSWRDAFPVVAAIGTVAIAIERILNTR
jgi:hypothetical protein